MREKFITVTCLTHKFDRGNGMVGLIKKVHFDLASDGYHMAHLIWAIVYG